MFWGTPRETCFARQQNSRLRMGVVQCWQNVLMGLLAKCFARQQNSWLHCRLCLTDNMVLAVSRTEEFWRTTRQQWRSMRRGYCGPTCRSSVSCLSGQVATVPPATPNPQSVWKPRSTRWYRVPPTLKVNGKKCFRSRSAESACASVLTVCFPSARECFLQATPRCPTRFELNCSVLGLRTFSESIPAATTCSSHSDCIWFCTAFFIFSILNKGV